MRQKTQTVFLQIDEESENWVCLMIEIKKKKNIPFSLQLEENVLKIVFVYVCYKLTWRLLRTN